MKAQCNNTISGGERSIYLAVDCCPRHSDRTFFTKESRVFCALATSIADGYLHFQVVNNFLRLSFYVLSKNSRFPFYPSLLTTGHIPRTLFQLVLSHCICNSISPVFKNAGRIYDGPVKKPHNGPRKRNYYSCC